jgi:ribosomal protein L37E
VKLGKLSNSVCVQCGKEAYKYRGKVYSLCAECGWDALVKLAGYLDDKEKTAKEKVDEVIHYENY